MKRRFLVVEAVFEPRENLPNGGRVIRGIFPEENVNDKTRLGHWGRNRGPCIADPEGILGDADYVEVSTFELAEKPTEILKLSVSSF